MLQGCLRQERRPAIEMQRASTAGRQIPSSRFSALFQAGSPFGLDRADTSQELPMTGLLISLAVEILRLALWLALLAAIFIPLERLFFLHSQKHLRSGWAGDLGLYFLNSLLRAFALSLPLAALATASRQILPQSYHEWVVALPFWQKMTAAFLLGEIGVYWGHRWSHEVPLLWRFHALHHSASHMDWLVNSRVHPVDMLFTRLCGLAPIALLGLASPEGHNETIPLMLVLAGTLWSFFVHANLRWRLGPLEHLLATPRFHHWHHGLEGPFNRNYASMLPALDRIWGTLHLPPAAWPKAYGLASSSPAVERDEPVPSST